MDRRTLLALLLTAIVIVVTPMVFPAPHRPQPVSDTAAAPAVPIVPDAARDSARAPATAPAAPPRVTRDPTPPPPEARAETTIVQTEHGIYRLVSPGGTPLSVTLPEYRSLRPGAASNQPVNLIEPGDRLFRLSLVSNGDTIALDTIAFRAEPQRIEAGAVVQSLSSTSAAAPVTLTYRFPADSFVFRLEGSLGGGTSAGASRGVDVARAGAASQPEIARWLLVTLPTRIRSDEADVTEDTRQLAVAYRVGATDIRSASFRDLDSPGFRVDTGSIRWVAERNKYFVVALIPAGRDSAFRALYMRGIPRQGGDPTAVEATAVLPLSANSFVLRSYAGPQAWNHLRRAAPELENVNPYGGWLHGLVQPFATIVMRMLLWMRSTLNVGYGWVLVIFGVLVRLLLWPLNQNAMRSSIKLQRIQPQLMEVQKKYRDNPEKQRDAMMKLYQEHGMSPFTPVLGCLPMLLPMPILFALYFVFQNTIELRGVSFMWLPDLSLKDPLYITPLFMGASMFLLSWIGMRGMPPTPQAKMMAYVMPVMFTVLFWNFASGLNLYYAVQNVAALPQQWLLARERQKPKT